MADWNEILELVANLLSIVAAVLAAAPRRRPPDGE
jgi:hypothetical protein